MILLLKRVQQYLNMLPLDDLACILIGCHNQTFKIQEIFGVEEYNFLMKQIAENVLRRSEKAVSDDEIKLYANLMISFNYA